MNSYRCWAEFLSSAERQHKELDVGTNERKIRNRRRSRMLAKKDERHEIEILIAERKPPERKRTLLKARPWQAI